MKWLGRIGMLLSFLSFWLAAPEILGEGKLRKLSEVGLRSIPYIVYFILANVVYIILVSILVALMEPSSRPVEPIVGGSIVIGLYLVAMLIGWSVAKKMRAWLIMPIIEKLADSQKTRRQLLIAGGLLFTLGFTIQFLSTF